MITVFVAERSRESVRLRRVFGVRQQAPTGRPWTARGSKRAAGRHVDGGATVRRARPADRERDMLTCMLPAMRPR